MGWEIFHPIRLLKASSDLTMDTSNEGASTSSLGEVSHYPYREKFLLYVWSKSTLFQFKTVVPWPALVKTSCNFSYKPPLSISRLSNKNSQVHHVDWLCSPWPLLMIACFASPRVSYEQIIKCQLTDILLINKKKTKTGGRKKAWHLITKSV